MPLYSFPFSPGNSTLAADNVRTVRHAYISLARMASVELPGQANKNTLHSGHACQANRGQDNVSHAEPPPSGPAIRTLPGLHCPDLHNYTRKATLEVEPTTLFSTIN